MMDNEIMQNLTKTINLTTQSNGGENQTVVWIPASPYIYTLLTFISGWTVIANGIILTCFYHNRHKKLTSFSRLTFSMAISDLFVGLVWFVYLAGNRNKGQMMGLFCSSKAYFSVSIQCVSLFHVLGFCISRNKTLQNPRAIDMAAKQKKWVMYVILVSWTVPLLVLLIPFVAWSKVTLDVIVCRLDVLFGNNFKKASTFVSTFYFTIQCLTDIINIATVVHLWLYIRKTVVPIQPSITVDVSTERVSIATTSYSQTSQTKLSTFKYQKHVMLAVGLLLLSFNLLTLPNMIGGFLLGGKLKTVNPDLLYLTNSCFVLSSGLNPIVYGVCVPAIKKSLIQLIRGFMEFFHMRR